VAEVAKRLVYGMSLASTTFGEVMTHQPTRLAAVALKTSCGAAAVLAMAVLIVCLANPSTSQPRPHVMNAVNAAAANSVDSTFLLTCGHDAVARPATYDVLCGNGIYTLVQLEWSTWGGAAATATGRYVMRDCTPTCAAGVDTSYPVRVMASDRVTRDGVRTYQELSLTFMGGPSDVLGTSQTENLATDGHLALGGS
jgi:hypothetical protein